MKTGRITILLTAMTAALLLTLAAARPSPAPRLSPVSASLPLTEAKEQGGQSLNGYLLRAEGDVVKVYRGGALFLTTGIHIDTLPASDREALRRGISVETAEALAQLLEDFDS